MIITYRLNACLAATIDLPDDFLVTLRINQEFSNNFVHIIKNYEGNILIPYETLIAAGIKESFLKHNSLIINNTKYVDLSHLPNITHNLDTASLILELQAPISYMKKQSLDIFAKYTEESSHLGPSELAQVSNEGHGIFLNYDLTFSNSRNIRSAEGFQDLNYYTDSGVLNQTFFARLGNNRHKQLGQKNELIRLDTSWIINNEQTLAQLKIGDGITKPADWSSASRFIGIQYASDFSIRPNIITYPLINYSSTADLPSTLDLYAANQIPLFRGDIKPGEFDLTNIPVPTGKGDVVIQARDINGKVQTFIIPYYITPQLLKPGLTDFSYAIGSQRFGYGTKNNDRYKYFISNFDYSLGITDNFTNSVHFESQKIASVGNIVYYKLNNIVILNASIATNLKSNIRKAQKYSLGFDYIDKEYFFNSNISFGNSNFIDTYSQRYVNRGGVYYQSSLGYSNETFGSISLNYLTYPVWTPNNMAKYGTIGINYDRRLKKNFHFRVNGGTSVRGHNNKYIIFSLNFNLDDKTYAQISKGRQNNRDNYNMNLSSPINGNLGWGYYAGFSKERQSNYNLRLSKNTSKVNSNIYLYHYRKTAVQQLNFSGGIVAIDQNIFLTQPIINSFALVKTTNIQDIPIYSNNQLITYTNGEGSALIPNLPSYTKSKISLDETCIPLDATIIETQLSVIPKWKAGSIVNFNLKEMKTMQMNLVDVKGNAVECNMDVTIEGLKENLFTGYNGLVFIRDIGKLQHFKGKACNDKNCCSFDASLLNPQRELIDLGNVICK